MARYLGMTLVTRILGENFPWGTLVVNVVGSFLLGLAMGAGLTSSGDDFSTSGAHAFVAIGFCGGLTTFSTFSLQTLSLVSEQALGKALGNVIGSVALCVCCVVSGYALGEGWIA